MESDLMQSFEDIGYTGPLKDPEKLSAALELGPKSQDFTGFVAWIADQIVDFAGLDESVNPTTSAEDASAFLLELSFFLKELGCVNTELMGGNVNQRLSTKRERILLLDYLITELFTSKILIAKKPEDKSMQVTLDESDTAKCLRETLVALKIQKPPDNITAEMLFQKLENKLNDITKKVPSDLIGKALFIGELSNNQWEKLEKLHKDLYAEYKIRREMLLKRLDVTVQSFLWSDRIKPKQHELNDCYHSKRAKMSQDPNVSISDLLASRDDLAIIEKTSNAMVRKNTQSEVNKVIIGAVPDRGGRAYEQEPPPPEMPSWQKDRVPGPQTSARGGGRGGGGGGRGGGRGRGGGGGEGARNFNQNNYQQQQNVSSYGNQGGGGGYRDHKDASKNFGQNYDNYQQPRQQQQQSGYSTHGGGYQSSDNRSYGSQGGNYSHQGGGNYQGQGSVSYQGQGVGGGYQSQGSVSYQTQGGGGYQSQGSVNYQSLGGGGGGYQSQGSGYQNQGGGGYQSQSYQSGDNRSHGKGGRVQGGWNQRDNSSSGGNYQRSGYSRGGRGGQRY